MRARPTAVGAAVVATLLAAGCGSALPRAGERPAHPTPTLAARTAPAFEPDVLTRVGTTGRVAVFGYRPCPGGSCAELLIGSGADWHQATPPPDSEPDAHGFNAVGKLLFTNAEDGYAIVDRSIDVPKPQLYVTADGARTWSRVAIPSGDTVGISADAAGFFAVLTHCTERFSPSTCTYRLAHAALGSTQWSSVPISLAARDAGVPWTSPPLGPARCSISRCRRPALKGS